MSEGLELQNVSIILEGKQLLSVDEIVRPGEILTIMGPSGSGKSSLLAYLGGFLAPVFTAKGNVVLNGTQLITLPPHKRRLGLLFQDPLLFPHMSVGENLLFALPPSVQSRQEKAEAALVEAGLDEFFDRDPSTLSGGQKSRVALMRVLLAEPGALLLDEPFSKLDADRRSHIRSLVFEKARENGLPTLLVTHDQMDADATGGKVLSLDGDA